ncbi:transcriptional regulator [Amycolatopsis antarctica]|uniref:Transcriptional regulator n=1 Tax=Amycolatopsis antarctica TaxID=1854586 RepID=A0A263DC62_9PSEU|nr:transcriptional regulator [Amycolatopsis antarctica]OZM75087.1 transcriptional regulator [Amycolatopsis antarctica]
MSDELAGRPIGERIQAIRERTGKSRPVVAGLVGRSAEWLKAVERGRRQPPRIDMLIRLGEALGVVDLSELTGAESLNISLQRRAGHEIVAPIREAIESADLTVSPDPRPNAEHLAVQAERAWQTWHASAIPRAAAGALLPRLIREGRRATRLLDGNDRRKAFAALASAYALSEQVLAWVADSALLWLAADRCMECAQQADDPETLAAAAWVLGNVWRSTGREEDAWRLVSDASAVLEPHLDNGSDDTRALWGSNQLHASITLARLGREGDAMHALDQADAMTARLPKGYAHPWTLFGSPNATMTGISVSVDLRKSGHAIDYANAGDLDAIPSLDRRARLWLELARGYNQRGDTISTLHTMQRATSISAESMRAHPIARSLAGELVTSGGRLVETEARALARQVGLVGV